MIDHARAYYAKYAARNPITGELVPLRYDSNDNYVYVTLDINGVYTIFSDCPYKFHEDIYTLEMVKIKPDKEPEVGKPPEAEAAQRAAASHQPENITPEAPEATPAAKNTPPGKVCPEAPEAAKSAASALYGDSMPGRMPAPPGLCRSRGQPPALSQGEAIKYCRLEPPPIRDTSGQKPPRFPVPISPKFAPAF